MTIVEDLKRNFLKDGTNEVHWGKIISSLVVLVALIGFIIWNNARLSSRDKDRLSNARYTIGLTGKMHHGIKNSQPTVRFYYTVLGRKYDGNQIVYAEYENSLIADGGRYYVEFSSKDPNNSKLLLGNPVPVEVETAPDSGWTHILSK